MANRSRPWTIEDTAISSYEQDRFDHRSVARELAEVVVGSREPMAIGLLGPFGSGKSSVVKLLEKELAVNNDWTVLHVSAEHHTGTARARALLYGLIDAARRKKLIDEKTWLSERACLEGQRQRTLPRADPTAHTPGKATRLRYLKAFGAAGAWIASMLAAVWLLGVIAVFIGRLCGIGHGVNTWAWFAAHGASPLTAVLLGGAVVAGVLAAGKEGALQALKGYEITVTSPRPDSTDELEQAFTRLIDHAGRRLVIAVDDIDRLTAADVLEALTTVRSLLLAGTGHTHKPVFVLSCDEDIVREAVSGLKPGLAHRPVGQDTADPDTTGPFAHDREAREEAAQEYLNKLFTVRRTLPAHDEHDLRAYVAGRLTHPQPHPVIAALGGAEVLDDVLDVLIHPRVRDPRHAIRLVNAFAHDYYLASLREQPTEEGQPRISPGEVTGYPLELARLAVLRQDHRSLYDRVADEHELLHILDNGLLGDSTVLNDPLVHDFLQRDGDQTVFRLNAAEWPGLNYLRATAPRVRDHRPQDLGPLITLGSSPASRLLGSQAASEIRLELLQRDSDALADRLTETGQLERVLRAMDATIDAARTGQELDNAIAATARALGQASGLAAYTGQPQGDIGRALLALTDHIARRREQMRVPLRADELVALLPCTRQAHLPALRASLAQPPSDSRQRRAWARTLLAMPTGPEADALLGPVDIYFDDLAENGDLAALESWLGTAEDERARWTPHAYGALVAMAARLDDGDNVERACALAGTDTDRHQWGAPLMLGIMAAFDASVDVASQVLGLLASAEVPDDGWGEAPVAGIGGGTIAAKLVEQLAAFLGDTDENTARVATVDLFRDWVSRVGGQVSPDSGHSANHIVAETVGENATTSTGMVEAAGRVLLELPDAEAAGLGAQLAAALPAHRADAALGAALQRVLVEYLRRTDHVTAASTLAAVDACLAALTEPVGEDSPAGQLSRQGLPALLSTSRGAARRGQIAERLIAAIPFPLAGAAPLPGHPGEVIGSLHLLFGDSSTRAEYLPRALERLQQSHQNGHVAVPVDFAATYLEDPGVNATWVVWITQNWGQITPAARDRALRGAIRPEIAAQPQLPVFLVQHLIATAAPDAWSWAAALYDRATDEDSQANLLAHSDGRAPELADRAVAAGADLLVSAFTRAADQVAGALALAKGNPQLSSAVSRYLQLLLDAGAWHPDQVRAAVEACPDPQPVWQVALDAIARDRTSLERAAAIVAPLAGTHPDSMPPQAVSVVIPAVLGGDSEIAPLLGGALRPLVAAARRKLVRAMTDASETSEQRARLNAFKRVCPGR